jgi:hypothetical protein
MKHAFVCVNLFSFCVLSPFHNNNIMIQRTRITTAKDSERQTYKRRPMLLNKSLSKNVKNFHRRMHPKSTDSGRTRV